MQNRIGYVLFLFMTGGAGSSRPRRRYVRFTRWRRQRFFALLAECGNVRAAAELAGVGLGCIYRLRRTEKGFVEAMAAAKDLASGVLRDAVSTGSTAPQDERTLGAGSAAPQDERGVRAGSAAPQEERPGAFDDMVIRRGVGGRLRRMAAGSHWWSARHDAVFFGHLRMTGNVSASARAAGFTPKSAWNRRERLPSFAAAMDAALAESEVHLQGRLTAEALNGTRGMDPGAQVPAMAAALEERLDVDLALRLLTWRERRARERARFRAGQPGRER